jgi:hypothetical protein
MLARIAAVSFLFAGGPIGSLVAQTDALPPLETWLPLRADEVVDDAASKLGVVRGRIDLPNGKMETSVIVCSRSGQYLAFTDASARTDDRYRVDAAVCDALARVPRRGEPRK